jgi:hypothetical protein
MGFTRPFFSNLFAAIALLIPASDFAMAEFIQLNPGTIRGKTVMLDEGSTLQYGADGSYVYTLGGRVSRGKWSIGSNGAVCIAFANGGGRCDTYLEQNGKLYLRNSNGSLYRVQFAR